MSEDTQRSEIESVGRGGYVVRQGECLLSIAFDLGFFWETLWNHPANAQLKEVRGDAMVLLEGDRLTIPEKTEKQEPGSTERRHTFRLRGVPARLKLRFLKESSPRYNTRCIIDIDGLLIETSTDGQGIISVPIRPNAKKAIVRLGKGDDHVCYEVMLGHLDPYDSIRGVQQRLRNLGMYSGGISAQWDEETAAAVREFRRHRALPEGDDLDDATCRAIRDENGS